MKLPAHINGKVPIKSLGFYFSVSEPICCHHPRDAKMPKPDENLDLGSVGGQPKTPHHKVTGGFLTSTLAQTL